MIDRILHQGMELALIVRRSFQKDGIEFFTPGNYSQQIGYMKRGPGYLIAPHIHNPVTREYLESTVLETGDVILLTRGGRGFEMLEETEMIEVKQVPYAGEGDKTRFEPNLPDELTYSVKQ